MGSDRTTHPEPARDVPELEARLQVIEDQMELLASEKRDIKVKLDSLTTRRKVQRQNAMAWLEEVLADGPLRASEVRSKAVEAGHRTKTLRRAADAIGVVRDPPGGGRNCVWKLPPKRGKAKKK